MGKTAKDETQAKKYLLGQLSESEQDAVEDRYFSDTALLEYLLVAEDGLIEAYAADRLPPSERELFEKHFLGSPSRRSRLEFTQNLREFVIRRAAERGRRMGWLARITHRWAARGPILSLSVATSVLFLIGCFWFGFRVLELHNQLKESRTESNRLRHRQERLQQDLAQERNRTNVLNDRLQEERSNRSLLPKRAEEPAHPLIATVVLAPSLRSIARGNKVVIEPGTKLVELRASIDMSLRGYSRIRASVETPAGDPAWSGDVASPKTGAAVSIYLPAALLKPGDYVLVLKGLSGSGNAAEIGDYQFGVVGK